MLWGGEGGGLISRRVVEEEMEVNVILFTHIMRSARQPARHKQILPSPACVEGHPACPSFFPSGTPTLTALTIHCLVCHTMSYRHLLPSLNVVDL
jgi:hypothetical protein